MDVEFLIRVMSCLYGQVKRREVRLGSVLELVSSLANTRKRLKYCDGVYVLQ